MPTVHREPAYAKLTRSLAVTGVRSDGYHFIEAEMVSLDLADELEISEETRAALVVSDEVRWVGSPALAPVPDAVDHGVPRDGTNLVSRALELVGRSAEVHLRKRIPSGAGLGGGSADAAAVLRWAGFDDLEKAAGLGADVPFCVSGGRALVTGIGEVVSPLVPADLAVVLVTPPFAVSSQAVYRVWDSLGGPRGEGGNDLEPAAIVVEPRLVWWRDLLAGVAGSAPQLAGSGSTWFLECGALDLACELAGELSAAVVAEGERAMVAACGTVPPAGGPSARRAQV